ncbi:MAG: HPr family phosphocarrier protein [Elusimicrobiales bacterium]|nr:HPr family phosphocarrier protein [Elusimicrobiales bacterium]
MMKITIKIQNTLGIHARPAGMIANTASGFECDVKIVKDSLEINAKSIMGIMMLAAGFGSEIEVVTNGKDEKEASVAINSLFEKKFDEE